MKKIDPIYFLPLVMFLFCFAQCRKEHSNQPHVGLSITLYNKPLDTIQFYLKGKWKCHFGKGGIGNTVQYYNSFYWTFSSNNRVLQSYNGSIVTDTTISWVWTLNGGTFTNGDSTFIMSFYDKRGYPYDCVIERIINDTLILHDDADDVMFYHFTKSN